MLALKNKCEPPILQYTTPCDPIVTHKTPEEIEAILQEQFGRKLEPINKSKSRHKSEFIEEDKP